MNSRTAPQRAPSPANTAYSTLSGLSNYRTEAYRTLKDKSVPALPTMDSRTIAKIHFDELRIFLASHLAKEPQNSRASAREKLTRLTRQQFQELSTDVYDELVRRNNNTDRNEVPFLPLRDDFHPKRNQARQKLATLPKTRFKDLASDVFYELGRRYPEFKEPDVLPDTPGSSYDEFPENSTYDKSKYANPSRNQRGDSAEEDFRKEKSRYSPTGRRPSQETTRPSLDRSPDITSLSYARRPSNDRDPYARRPSEDVEGPYQGRRPSKSSENKDLNDRRPVMGNDNEQYGTPPKRRPVETAAPSTATSGVVIPNKSTIAAEEIQVPYGRDDRISVVSGSSSMVERSPRLTPTTGGLNGLGSSPWEKSTSPSLNVGLSALGVNIGPMSNADTEEYYDTRTSVSGSTAPARRPSQRDGEEDVAKIKREYELKLSTMQNRIASLESQLEAANKAQAERDGRNSSLTEELASLRTRAEGQSASMLALQRELDDLRASQKRDRDREVRRQEEADTEVRRLRERNVRLEDEKEQMANNAGNSEAVEELRADLQNLLEELKDLSLRNDELSAEKDADLVLLADLEGQVKEYKRKYEQAKTELRNVKATSQLFLQAPKTEDQMPVSVDGGILDIHVTDFQSAVDSLLTAGRSSAPSRVLPPMKAVVNAVTSIIDDVRNYEQNPRNNGASIDPDVLNSLCERAEATLSNLATATKTHATSYGLSPVSLLDAAASHVSATITELARLVQIRKSTKAEQESLQAPSTIGYTPSLKPVDELRSPMTERYARNAATGSPGRQGDSRSRAKQPASPIPMRKSGRGSSSPRRNQSDRSSSNASSPPAIFDTPPTSSRTNGTSSDDSAPMETREDSWEELKPYLEAQSESIVYAIQSVLSSVRSTKPSPNLNENLTQIITIVSSIVAVCKDSLPPGSVRQGNVLLEELSDHCNKLSEVQSGELTKEARQIMAKSSFAIANAMKDLVKLDQS